MKQSLVVELGKVELTLPYDLIEKVILKPDFTPVPFAPKSIAGLTYIHGNLVTLIHLSVLLNVSPVEEFFCLIARFQEESYGFLITNVRTMTKKDHEMKAIENFSFLKTL